MKAVNLIREYKLSGEQFGRMSTEELVKEITEIIAATWRLHGREKEFIAARWIEIKARMGTDRGPSNLDLLRLVHYLRGDGFMPPIAEGAEQCLLNNAAVIVTEEDVRAARDLELSDLAEKMELRRLFNEEAWQEAPNSAVHS